MLLHLGVVGPAIGPCAEIVLHFATAILKNGIEVGPLGQISIRQLFRVDFDLWKARRPGH